MNLKLGDFVRFVDENLEGHITRIIDKDTIGVTDANDFEIPVLASKVTLVHGEMNRADDNEGGNTGDAAAIQALSEKEFIKEGVFLALITDPQNHAIAHFHLLNETSYQLLLSFTTERNGDFKGEFAGSVAPGSAKKIYSAKLGDIHSWPKFRLELLYHSTSNIEPQAPLVYHQSIKGKDLSVAKQEIAMLKEKGWQIRLDSSAPVLDLEKLKASFQ
jgi:hypothetical protein